MPKTDTSSQTCYRITYREPEKGKIVSLKAKTVTDSSLGLSFISISDFIFDTSPLLINPAEEELRKRFSDVRALHLSIYTIISIEEIGSGGKGLNFKMDKSNLVIFSSEHKPDNQ